MLVNAATGSAKNISASEQLDAHVSSEPVPGPYQPGHRPAGRSRRCADLPGPSAAAGQLEGTRAGRCPRRCTVPARRSAAGAGGPRPRPAADVEHMLGGPRRWRRACSRCSCRRASASDGSAYLPGAPRGLVRVDPRPGIRLVTLHTTPNTRKRPNADLRPSVLPAQRLWSGAGSNRRPSAFQN